MSNRKSRSDMISAAVQQYLLQRGITQGREEIGVAEYATLVTVDKETSMRNTVSFNTEKLDAAVAETEYTKFKVWISESADHYKPELAQLLYPLFTHLYIRLLHCQGAPNGAQRFHKRHLSTFLGNPEFKLFIQQLAEANSLEDLEQNPAIVTFRAARYSATLTSQTYAYLLRFLETSKSHLILNILNQEVDVSVGDPLGAGSRQDIRAALGAEYCHQTMQVEDGKREELESVRDLIKIVREGPPAGPCIALYRIQAGQEGGLAISGETDATGSLLAAGCEDSQVRLWNLLPADEPILLDVEASCLNLAADDERSVMTATPPLRTVPAGRSRCLRGHTGPVYAASFLPGDGHIVSVSEDTTVRLWDRSTGAGLAALHGHLYPVWCVAADCLGVNFVTGSHDRTARLWRPEVAHPLRVYSGHEGDVDCVSFHPNCSYLLSGSCDRTVRMWSVTEGRCVRVLIGHKGAVTSLQVSPCGRLAASGGEDKRIKIWDLAEGKWIKELKGHTDTVNTLVWGDSRLLCSGGMDGTIRVWDVGTAEGESIGTYSVGGNVLGANFTETNTLIVTAQESCGE